MKLNLNTKIILVIIVLAAAIGGTSILLANNIMRNSYEQELEKRGLVIAQLIAERITNNVINSETVAAHEVLLGVVQEMDDTDFAYITDFDGKMFAHSFKDGFPIALIMEHKLIRAGDPYIEKYLIDEGLGLLVGYPLIDGMKANLYVGLDQTDFYELIKYTQNLMIGIVTLVTLVTVLHGISLSNRILHPLIQLAEHISDYDNKQIYQVFDYHGRIQEVASLIRSFNLMITERRQAEQALRQSEEQYRSVVEDTPGLICKFLPDGAITFVNQEYCKFFRKKHDELIGTNIQSTIPKEIRENVMSNIASLTEESPIITFENENIIDDKHSRWMRWTDRALFDNEGQISSIQSFGVDITERRQAEEALHQEQEKAQKYLDIAEVMIMAVNTEGEITLINKKGNRILGYEESELLGRNWFDTCVPERERKERRQILRKMIAGEAEIVVYDNESLVLTRSGEERTIAWHDTVISDEKGHNIGSLSSGEDISKRVRAEHLLNALNQAAIAMGVAQTHQEIFNSVSEELKQLDISCTLFPLDQAQDKLYTKYLSYESAALIAAEKLGGNKHQDFSFPIEDVDKFREVVREKKTLFIENTEQILQQILPKLARKLSTQIIKILRVPKNISAPLIVEDQVIGVLSIQSNKLTREDVPTATAFADQLSSAWNKIELLQNLKNTVEGTIHTIAATVEVRDPYTAGHQKRVSDLAVAIATEMHLSDEKVEGIKMAGIIHDLGKIQVPAEILSNPGKLTELEFQIIQTHPQVGFDLLKNIEFPWPLAQMVLQHHEKMDGSGYPQGLKGEKIMLEARILAVADVVEAMSSHRPYRPAHGIEKALAQIKKDRGTLLDPKVVDACLKIFKEGYKSLDN